MQLIEIASVIPLDIPIPPCTSFHGRRDVLCTMESFFYGAQGEKHGRRSFAICGLGGSGKTQTVLHFLLQNLPRYKAGVLFLNASSKASLKSDFSRIHQLLNLPEANDKILAVKNWLSREENSQWLMVFDNADDLLSVPVSKYFPVTPWGHIVITSRDQEAIGGVAEEGCNLRPLASEEATALLLDTAGIRQRPCDDIKIAEEIVGLLGSLPLAISQAGAFIRSRHKDLGEYKNLFLRARSELLGFKPRLADSDRTVLSTWEVNFKQVEHDSKAATSLLLLFCFLEPTTIPEVVLHRGTMAQNRWSEEGEVVEVSAEAEGVDCGLIQLIQNDMDFDEAIEKLRSFSFVSCSKDASGLRNFSVHPLVQYCATQRIPSEIVNKWRQQAILLICHAFPRSKYLDSINGEIGRTVLPQLLHVLAEYDKMSLEHQEIVQFRHDLAATLLAASRFSDSGWKVEAVDRAKQILKGDPDRYMNAWLIYRESAVLRMSGKSHESDKALQSFVQSKALSVLSQGTEVTPRYNAQRGDLIISFAENLIRQWKLEEAKNELREWSPVDPNAPSSLERITLRARDIILGKALRYQGHFKESLALLEKVLRECQADDFFDGTGWYRVLLSNVAELYCEVGRPQEAVEILQSELKPMIEKGTQDIATGRRLRLSLAEALFGRNSFSLAEETLLGLKEVYQAIKKPDHTTRMHSFRVWIGLARITHQQARLDEAMSYWTQALADAERLKMADGINAGIVRYSIAHILHATGKKAHSHNMLAEAKRNLTTEHRVFWIAGFNSHWHDEIIRRMNKECGGSC